MTQPNAAQTDMVKTSPVGMSADEFFSDRIRLFTTLDLATDEGKAAALALTMTGTSTPLAETKEAIIDVENFLVHSVNFADKDGVDVTADRIVLIAPDGQAFSCVSSGVRKSLQMIVGMFGMAPWKPARKFKCVPTRTRRGFTTFNLVPVVGSKVAAAEPTPKK